MHKLLVQTHSEGKSHLQLKEVKFCFLFSIINNSSHEAVDAVLRILLLYVQYLLRSKRYALATILQYRRPQIKSQTPQVN